jgi:hypothetical protein
LIAFKPNPVHQVGLENLAPFIRGGFGGEAENAGLIMRVLGLPKRFWDWGLGGGDGLDFFCRRPSVKSRESTFS